MYSCSSRCFSRCSVPELAALSLKALKICNCEDSDDEEDDKKEGSGGDSDDERVASVSNPPGLFRC